MLRRIEAEMACYVAMNERTRGDHFCIEPNVRCEKPMKVATMAVCPIDHRGYSQTHVTRASWGNYISHSLILTV